MISRTNFSNKRKYKRDPKKTLLIRSIFEIDDSLVQTKKKNIIKINYNKNIYFKKRDDSNDLQKIITNIIKNPKNNETKENIMKNNNIFYNKSIENNYDDNNINNIKLQKENSSLKQNFVKNNGNINKKFPKLNFDFPKSDENELMSVPCMNCGNLIAISDIENHSLICLKVSDEIMKNESSKYELYSIDYKLRKLKEHLLSIVNKNNNINSKNNNEIEIKDLLSNLLEYIKEVILLQKIDIPTIKKLKTIIKNLENISIKYQNNISKLILIDRTKILVKEKFKIFKNTYKLEVNNKTINSSKTGEIKNEDLKEKIQQLEKKKEETELGNKIKNQRKSAEPINNSKKLKSNFINSIISEKKNEEDDSIFSDQDNNNNINNNIKVEEIISDVENNSNMLSINTSISNVSDIGQNFFVNNNVRLSNTNSKNINNEFSNNQLDFNNKNINNDYSYEEEKKDKKKFFLEVLKVKFEELHSTHKGQMINQKYIWEECKKYKIPNDKWTQFILSELNNPYKYLEIQKKEKKNNSKKPIMEIIKEEK